MPRRNEDNVHYFAFPRHSAPIVGCNDAIHSPFSRPEFRPDLPVLLLRFTLQSMTISPLFMYSYHFSPTRSPLKRESPYAPCSLTEAEEQGPLSGAS